MNSGIYILELLLLRQVFHILPVESAPYKSNLCMEVIRDHLKDAKNSLNELNLKPICKEKIIKDVSHKNKLDLIHSIVDYMKIVNITMSEVMQLHFIQCEENANTRTYINRIINSVGKIILKVNTGKCGRKQSLNSIVPKNNRYCYVYDDEKVECLDKKPACLNEKKNTDKNKFNTFMDSVERTIHAFENQIREKLP